MNGCERELTNYILQIRCLSKQTTAVKRIRSLIDLLKWCWVNGTECISSRWVDDLSTETVQGTTLSLEGVDYIESSHGLAASMLSVDNHIADHVL